MNKLQNEFVKKNKKAHGFVIDGRDISSRIIPCAEIKFFIDANIRIRTNRRINEVIGIKYSDFSNMPKIVDAVRELLNLHQDIDHSIEPVVYFNLNQKSKIYSEEIFGPIITINSFKNIDETIKDLNKSKYGLACYLFSKDKSNISYFLKNIRYGRVWVNDNLINFPELPLGGFRQSGIGRESGVYGLDSYTEIRSVIIKL